jgi:polysaccharide chain length determinant protein (PEP-CTERM system associated)
MNGITNFDVFKILAILQRRKNIIVSAFVVISILAVYAANVLPRIYRSSTVIVITPQKVPSSFVTSTVTMDLGERMRSTIQEILSRTRLEKIIEEYHLYVPATDASVEERVERLRRKINIELRRNNVFELSFESESPEKAQQVTSRLASLFIEQNLSAREQQAESTKSFINTEAERLRKELEQQEAVVNRYKAANLFELPDQLNANLRTLEQLRRELDSNDQRLLTLQERKGVLQKQSVESDIPKLDVVASSLVAPGAVVLPGLQLEMKKKELDSLLQRYSNKHPDVIRLQKEIQALQNEEGDITSTKPANPTNAKPANPTKVSTVSPLKQVLQKQITDIDSEIQTLRAQAERIRGQIDVIRSRVDNTPSRAIELSKISRGYEITLKKYQDLLAKGLESELSENMEKKLKGEQFQILDAADFPLKAISPRPKLIIFIGILAGLAAGVALAFLWENLDTSFNESEQIDAYVNVPLLATVPVLITRGSILEQRRTQGVLFLASIGTLALGIVCVRIFGTMYF